MLNGQSQGLEGISASNGLFPAMSKVLVGLDTNMTPRMLVQFNRLYGWVEAN